jgi:hypothetical protein
MVDPVFAASLAGRGKPAQGLPKRCGHAKRDLPFPWPPFVLLLRHPMP